MPRIICLFLSTILLLFQQGQTAAAQQKRYIVEGRICTPAEDVMRDGQLVTSLPRPIPGAVVSLITPTDTLNMISDGMGEFLFRKVTDRHFRLKVQHIGYDDWARDFDADTLDRIRVILKENKEQLEAAVVKEEVPVFEFIGDTLKYNVAAVQQVSSDDMLADVMERLPGISVSNNLVEIMNEQVARIYIDGRLVFGDDVGNPLRYLAGSEVISLRVYDQASREERLGLIPKGSRKERVVNVETRSKLKTALIAQVTAGYGRNFEKTGTESDNRYVSGLAGNWFSEMTLLSVNAYLNNVGASNEYSAVSKMSTVPSSYSRIGYVGAMAVKKFRDPEIGDALSVTYSYGNRKDISENSLSRVYSPDENWTSRTYLQDSRSESDSRQHMVQAWYNSTLPYMPMINLSFSAADTDRLSLSRMQNDIDGVLDGFNQGIVESGRDYSYSARMSKSFPVGKFYMDAAASIDGGRSSGTLLQRDTTLASSSVSSYISDPTGSNLSASASLSASGRIADKLNLNASLNYSHNHSAVNKLSYLDAVSEANLDTLTSDIHTYNYDTYSASLGLSNANMTGLSFSVRLKAQYDRQRREGTMPASFHGNVDYVSLIPHLSLRYSKRPCNINVALDATPVLPSYEQIRRDFDTGNPMFITRGNPDLKKSTDCRLSFQSSFMVKKAHSLSFGLRASYMDNRIVRSTRYIAEDTEVDGFMIPKGSTFSTYENVDGAVAASPHFSWSVRIRPLKLFFDARMSYDFSRDPSYVEDRLNVAYRHVPGLSFNLKSDFSRKYRLELRSMTSYSDVRNTGYSDVNYLDQNVSLQSKNQITGWMFVNADYTYMMRHPFKGAGRPLHDHRLNAMAGFRIPNSGVEINLSCYDILNMTSSFKTTVVSNYTQTTFNPNLGRIYLVTILWRFNSTQKGGNVNFGYRAPSLGRDFEKVPRI